MEFLNVIAAALAAFAFGAVWYMSMSKPWIRAAEIPVDASGKPVHVDTLVRYLKEGGLVWKRTRHSLKKKR